jgi:hypothetical protein
VSQFFKPPPPPRKPPEQHRSPAWSGPPEGTLPGVVALELVLAHSRKAAVYVTHLNAYATGFEFELKVVASAGAEHEFDLDLFGRHWPRVGEKRDELPPGLLRVGLQFADGGKATSISGPPYHPGDPPRSPVMWPLSGSGGGGASWRQDYWVWPLPPPGEFELVCEWPAGEIPLTRSQLDSQLILDAPSRARSFFPEADA